MQYRKFTRLKNYDYSTNGYYFVTVCVNDHRDLFGDIKDGKMVLNDVGKIINDAWQWLGKQYEYVELDQFIIMPNHIHVIICINSRGGSRTAPTRRTAPTTDGSRTAPTSQHIPAIRSGAIHRVNKGISLIIAVFAMMLFSVLGWTLVRIQSTDFESNVSTGNLNSERALNLAEAGAEWTLQKLNLNGGFRTDATNGYPLGYAQHSISPGQYRVSCLDGIGDDFGRIIITSSGYTPLASSYNTTRQVRLKIQVGSLTNALQTQVPDALQPQQGLFDWSLTRSGHTNYYIEGNILAGHYNADGAVGEAPYDELNDDYTPAVPLPPDNSPQSYQRGFSAAYPSINMEYFYNTYDASGDIWPDPSNRPITAVATITTSGNNQYLVVSIDNFFNSMNNEAIRRVDDLDWQQGDGGPASGWKSINGVSSSGRPNNRARISTNPLDWVNWPDEDGLTPGTQVTIKIVKRFYDNSNGNDYSDERWYIGGEIADPPGISAETIIDTRGGEVRLRDASLVSEGDIVIKGGERIQMQFSGGGPGTIRYPVLATKSGNIISGVTIDGVIINSDTPNEDNENARMNQRRVSGLIYSETGNVSFNYLVPTSPGPTGNLVYGNRVTLDGRVRIVYDSSVFNSGGFVFSPGATTWDEE